MSRRERTHILRRIGKEDMLLFAQKTWQSQRQVADFMASEALSVICETYRTNPTFFSGKSTKGIVGGLFYLLGHRYSSIKTQKEIARSLNTTEMTIRASYREWMKPVQSYSRRRKEKIEGCHGANDLSLKDCPLNVALDS